MQSHDTTNVTPKLCECGCGQPAPIAQRTVIQYGHVKGQPVRFVLGHNNRLRHKPLFEYFWDNVQRAEPNECWLWQGSHINGYGKIYRAGMTHLAHRFSYEIHKGVIPKGMSICHACDTPLCVNPAHLWLGTRADNTLDMFTKGRAKPAKGEHHHFHKLTENDIHGIRSRYAQGELQRVLAQEYGVNRSHISMIVHRKVWKHIP